MRQIASGIDSFSRGFLTDRKASSGSILGFVPLNETAFERSETLFTWVQKWIGVNNIEPLTPEGWFDEGHGMQGGNKNGDGIWMPYHMKNTFLWSPAPSVSDLVLRKLWEAVHKQPNSLHVFIYPELIMTIRGRLMFNMADLVVYVPPREKFWPSSMHELLVIGFVSPLIPHRPWRLRGTPKVMELGMKV